MGFEMESNLMNGYKTAYDMALTELKGRDSADIVRNTDARHDSLLNTYTIKYLGVDHVVNCSSGEVSRVTPEGLVSAGTTVGVLILHYLLNAVKKPLTGRFISFREVKGVSGYFPTFNKRAILPFQGTFEAKPEALIQAGLVLGGATAEYGDASTTLSIFPNVEITYVVWRGDDEIPPSAAILFDENITSYLPGEDIVLAASFGTYALMKRAKG